MSVFSIRGKTQVIGPGLEQDSPVDLDPSINEGGIVYTDEKVMRYSDGVQWRLIGTGEQGVQGIQGLQGFQGFQGDLATVVTIIGAVDDANINPPGDPQTFLANTFPTAVGGDGVIDDLTNDLYVYNANTGIWINTGDITGTQGVQGIQGLTGIQGSQGEEGIQGIRGFVGSQGIQGLQGDTGIQGDFGVQGAQGTIGPQGVQGIQGFLGIQGFDGVRGDEGLQGTQGLQGLQGTTGIQGTQGLQGTTGAQGTQGIQGETGIQGIDGNVGAQGIQGVQGVQGETGIQGVDGNIGSIGPQGIQGVQGIQGTTGIQGIDGNIGAIGPQGTQGLQGFQGFQGPTGFQGTDGTVGSTGSQGTQGVQGFIGFQGFQGVDGNVGALGPQGVQGLIGPSGGVQGVQGLRGFQGFQGFSGDVGSPGVQGVQGLIGPSGGVQGIQGPRGFQGFQGLSGDVGSLGPQGVQGFQGFQGPRGIQGFLGAQGATGTGSQGVQGFQGFTGATGAQGTTGLQGLQGFKGDTADDASTIIVEDIWSTNLTQRLQNHFIIFSQDSATPTTLYQTKSPAPTGSDNLYWNPATGILYTDQMRAPVQMRSDDFRDENNTAYYVQPAGTSNLNNLVLDGNINIDGDNIFYNGLGNTSGDYLNYGTQNGITYYENGTPAWRLSGASSVDSYISHPGNFGLGTTSPSTKLQVVGDITASGYVSTDHVRLSNKEIGDLSGDGYLWFDSSEGVYNQALNSAYTSPALLWSRSNFTAGSNLSVSYNSAGRPTLDTVSDPEFAFIDIASYISHTGDLNTYFGFVGTDRIIFVTAGNERLRIAADGNVGIGTTSPSDKLHVVGNVRATNFNSTSDISLKTDFTKIDNALDKLSQINGYLFTYKDSGKRTAGVIAQEIEKILPEVVEGEEGNKTVAYGNLIGLLIEAIKELNEKK